MHSAVITATAMDRRLMPRPIKLHPLCIFSPRACRPLNAISAKYFLGVRKYLSYYEIPKINCWDFMLRVELSIVPSLLYTVLPEHVNIIIYMHIIAGTPVCTVHGIYRPIAVGGSPSRRTSFVKINCE